MFFSLLSFKSCIILQFISHVQDSQHQDQLSSTQSLGGGHHPGVNANTTTTPHSPDSGMAISDGVSSSGSPATTGGGNNGGAGLYGQTGVVSCLGGPASSGAGSSASMSSTNSASSSAGDMHNLHLQQGSHQYNLPHSHAISHPHGHMPSPLLNVGNNGRPTQARSPYEWMKKPTYSTVPASSSSSSNNGKFELCK